jgi:ribosomal protein S18 acetylase RimI-like enzyme
MMDCSHVQFFVHDTVSPQGCCPTIDLEQVRQLFHDTAFWARDRSVDEWAIAIANSRPVVTAWDDSRMIGFVRATSDGIFRATVWDVAIHPDYQGAGLGRRLVETILMHPHVNRAERVYLMTTNQQKFYKRIGFEENKSTTLVLFNQGLIEEDLRRSLMLAAEESSI